MTTILHTDGNPMCDKRLFSAKVHIILDYCTTYLKDKVDTYPSIMELFL